MKIGTILASLGLQSLPSQVMKRLTGAVEHEAARRGGDQLGRGICETVDGVMEAHGGPLSPTSSIEVGTEIAKAAAAQLRHAADVVEAYASLQEEVVEAKVAGDAARLAAARSARNAGTAAVKEALRQVVPE